MEHAPEDAIKERGLVEAAGERDLHDRLVGLTIDNATGLISGTPAGAAGVYPVALMAANAGGAASAALAFTLTVPEVSVVVLGEGEAVEDSPIKGKVAVRRTGDLSIPLSVRHKVKGTAAAGVDYKGLSGTVTIPVGAAQAKLKIKPLDDTALEGILVAKVKLKVSLDGGYAIGSPHVAKVLVLPAE